MADWSPRPSTDQETAPLLRDPDAEDNAENEESTLMDRINSVAQEPLTPLSKVLLVIALILLLLSSVFIGLFAGVQHKLNLERGRHDEGPPSTISVTFTATATSSSIATTTLSAPSPTGIPEEPVCLTGDCIMLAASILSSMDTNQDPCENFYEFANGGWLRAHPLPADKGSFGNFEALAQDNEHVIQRILEDKSSTTSFISSSDDQILAKLRGFYSSCMNESYLDTRGHEPLMVVINNIRQMYRRKELVIKGETEKNAFQGLTAALAYMHSRGLGALFSFDIEGDVGVDPNHLVLWFSQPSLGLPSKRKIIWPPWPWPPWGGDDGDDDGDNGGKKPVNKTKRVQKLAKEVVKFESEIAHASLDLDILYQDPIATYNPAPISNLTTALPQIHFDEYFSTFAPRNYPDRVIITYPPYAHSLSEILNSTSKDVVEAYLVVRAALSLSSYLGMGTEAWQAQRTLVETLSGIKKGAVGDRAEYCRREQGKGYQDIVKAFQRSLKNIDWMDEQSAKAASNKAQTIRVKVGYPLSPDTTNPASIASYYARVTGDENTFFENVLSASVNDEIRGWLQLGKQRDLNAWEMYPSMVNAYFNPPANEIVFPAGILQPPFFNKDWPAYISYGAFGHVASHELTHAFDSAGRLYNQQGKLEQWWTNATSAGFQSKLDCIIEQFSAYSIDDGKGGKVYVNGNLTSGENIGDTGLIQAYRAWKAQYDSSHEAGREYLLPGLSYTREQLFFISFARVWARSMKAAAAVQRIRTDPHSPNNYRVDGTVFNIPEFAEAFKCSSKARLNPPSEKQCIFWGRS
ncbi:endothelin-converting enzyme 1 [Lentinula edodes]|uniref:Endothelin-converting enzyme 1 n=1 Tax=Lentinula edodes TaxID=5353 RepID=A0A1Q3EGG6_LENED|nr:endothelin-converting enzyme 1 [Lentinula edodes]